MLSLHRQRLLIIAPHPDDEVLGCGGLIHRCKHEGGEVYVLFLTVGTTPDYTARGFSTEEERRREVEHVAKLLQYDGYRFAFPGDHHLRLDALPQRELIETIENGPELSLKTIQPTLVLTTLPTDYNQDHRAAAVATITASRPQPPTYKSLQRCILHYEIPPASWTILPDDEERTTYVELTEEDLRAKREALELYASQLKHPEAPISLHGIQTLAELRGLQCGARYAEAFSLKRLLL
jgi:LmbE family N-acetylglucosaminyl deacetylase